MVIAVCVICAYGNSTSGSFLFDDFAHIHHKEHIRNARLWEIVSRERRPVVALSLAFNHAIGGLEPAGYHVFNIAVHIAAALILFGVVRRTMRLVERAARVRGGAAQDGGGAEWTALATAAIWAVHPVQTQSVTYIIQRGESLMGLFYLLTLYCVIRGAESKRRATWHLGAVLACGLGMGSKAVMISAPLAVLAYDRTFLATSVVEAMRRRWTLYAGLAATWCIPVLCGVAGGVLSTAPHSRAAVGFGIADLTPMQYALTQPRVILEYIRIALWPALLCFDHSWPLATGALEAGPYVAVILALGGLSLWGLWRRTWLGFAGTWFFIVLAPTSSIVPIRDALVEHRMYLSLAGVVLLGVRGVSWGVGKMFNDDTAGVSRATLLKVAAAVAAVAALGAATRTRNETYMSDVSLWRDVVAKRPNNARAHLNLGVALDDPEEALVAYREALRIKPDYADAHFNLGRVYAETGRADAALEAYGRAIADDASLASAHFNLGNLLKQRGQVEDSIAAYRGAIAADAQHVGARVNLGTALASIGDVDEAARQLREAVEIDPASVEAHVNLGMVLVRSGEFERAIGEYEIALGLLEHDKRVGMRAHVHYLLGSAHERRGDIDGAIGHYERAVALDHGHVQARRALTAARGRIDKES